jgi:hypothetical protein
LTAGVLWWGKSTSAQRQPVCIGLADSTTGSFTPAAAPEEGSLTVIEQGFSQDLVPPNTVSLGVVVKNTSALVAMNVPVTFRVLDSSGRTVLSRVLPVDKVSCPSNKTVRKRSPGLTGKRHQPYASYGKITFTARSPYCEVRMLRQVTVLYRDEDGRLLGGDSKQGDSMQRFCYPGTFTSAETLRNIPSGADDSRAEVFVYVDVEVPTTTTPTTSTTPATASNEISVLTRG